MADLKIHIIGQDSASGVIGGVQRALGGVAQVAGGILAAGILQNVASGFVSIGRDALQAVAGAERTKLALESLAARELARGETVNVTRMAVIGLTQKETAEVNKLSESLPHLINARDKMQISLAEEEFHLNELKRKWGENGNATRKAAIDLKDHKLKFDELNQTIAAHQAEIGKLADKQSKLVPVTSEVTSGQKKLADVMAEAKDKAKELYEWSVKLAIKSPFTQEGVNTALKTAMAYGFNIKAAKDLTEVVLDFAAATGQSEAIMGQVGYALGQIHNSDKLMTQDLRQLMTAGVDVNGILKKMGFSLQDVGEKSISSKDFLSAFTKTMKEDFGGAGEKQATTFSGLLASLSDIKKIGLQDLFEGTFGAIQPFLVNFVDLLTSDNFKKGLREIGGLLGQQIAGGLKLVGAMTSSILPLLGSLRAIGLSAFAAFQKFGAGGLLGVLGVHPTIVMAAQNAVASLSKVFDTLFQAVTAFQKFGAGGALTALGVDPATVTVVKGLLFDLGQVFHDTFAKLAQGDFGGALSAMFGGPARQRATASAVGLVNAILAQATAMLPQWLAALQQWGRAAGQWLLDALPGVLTNVGIVIRGLIDAAFTYLPQWSLALSRFALEAVQWIVAKLPDLITNLGQFLNTMIDWVGANAPTWAQRLGLFASELSQWVVAALPGLAVNLGTAAGTLLAWTLETAANLLGWLLPMAAQFVSWIATDVVPQLPAALGAITEAIVLFLIGAGLALAPEIQKLADRLWQWVTAPGGPADQIGGALEQLKTNIINWLNQASTSLTTNVVKFGENLMLGIRQGIVNGSEKIADAIRAAIESAINAAKAFLGIHSPSVMLAATIGKPMMQGVESGILGYAGQLASSFSGAIGSSMGGTFTGASMSSPAAARGSSVYNSRILHGDNFYINVNDQSSAGLLLAMIEERRTDRLNQSMGG